MTKYNHIINTYIIIIIIIIIHLESIIIYHMAKDTEYICIRTLFTIYFLRIILIFFFKENNSNLLLLSSIIKLTISY